MDLFLNAYHEGEELYRPYTVESFTARLARAPDLYGWDNVLVGDGAVLGVWHAGQRRTRREGENETLSVRSLVLDYGFLPATRSEFERLLVTAAGAARERGHTHLNVFTSDPSRGSGVLRALSDGIETYELLTPELAEPARATERGVYVDQVYF